MLEIQLLWTFLFRLRDRFSNSVMKRREYLDQQIQEMIGKPSKYNVLFFAINPLLPGGNKKVTQT